MGNSNGADSPEVRMPHLEWSTMDEQGVSDSTVRQWATNELNHDSQFAEIPGIHLGGPNISPKTRKWRSSDLAVKIEELRVEHSAGTRQRKIAEAITESEVIIASLQDYVGTLRELQVQEGEQ